MSTPALHLERSNGYTACGWIARNVRTDLHRERITCKSCLKVIYGAKPRRPDQRAEARRGGTHTGLGKLCCRLCGRPYATHLNYWTHPA